MADDTDDDVADNGADGAPKTTAPAESADPTGPAPEPPIGDAEILITNQIRSEVSDGLELVDFIVKTGSRTANGLALAPETLKVIKVTAGKIRLFESTSEPVRIMASE
jgi:hypothetical protein